MPDDSNLPSTLPSILAMVIGIDKYPHKREFDDLNGAVADADHFEAYLKGPLAELSGQEPKIISLRNATRKQILDGFFSLQTGYLALKDKAMIIIFYAGHGARTKKPKEWTDWQTNNDEIEMICPSDIGKVDGNKAPVEGIYDRTISALINKLSTEMGPNITLIMDCCCSGGINRGDKESDDHLVRKILDPPQACATTDEEICNPLWSDNVSFDGRGGGPAHGFSGKLQGSHVLLAACGPNESACESRQLRRGLFSHRLLEILMKEDVRTLTYTSLMHKLKLRNRQQTARCEGHGVNWRLFSNQEDGSDWSFILTHNEDKIVTLEAGDAQGITVGSVLSVHTTNLTDSPSIGKLQVTSVNKFSSILDRFPEEERFRIPEEERFRIPDLFYCKLLKTANSTINVYCKDKKWLASVFPHDFIQRSGVVLVDTARGCDLELAVSNGKVSFYRHHKLVTPHLDKCASQEVSTNAVDSIQNIVCATRTFYYHLTRPMTDKSAQAQIKLKLLNEASSLEETVLIPFGKNLISKEPATVRIVVDEDAMYGMTITNESKHNLYPFVLYFDPTELTIEAWYPPFFDIAGGGLQASNAGNGRPIQEIGLLRPDSSLAIGYGESNVWPWGFWLSSEDQRDLGFFRVFLSTRPMPSFFSMTQGSPFPVSNIMQRGGGKRDPRLLSRKGVAYAPKDECTAKMVTIIQTREKVKSRISPLNLFTNFGETKAKETVRGEKNEDSEEDKVK